jgi:hypothetical protein
MAAEEFEHAIKGFDDTDQHHNRDQKVSVPPIGRSPIQKKEEEPGENKPFEEFDPGGKGKERKLKAQS